MLANILISGSIIALVAVGFSLIYRTTRFFYFAHAVVFTAGAYFTLALSQKGGLPLGTASSLSVVLCAIMGCSFEVFVFRPLRRRGASALVLLLASLGLYVILQNLISCVWGDETEIIRSGIVSEGLNVLGARITPIQFVIIITGISSTFILAVFLRRTRVGTSIRAIASDADLASLCGIQKNRIFLLVFALGSALAGGAGILVALDVDMNPNMGMHYMLLAVVAVIIGGVESVAGVAMGALLLTIAQQLGIWVIGSEWQDAIAFVVLCVFLLVRPQGFFGKRIRKASV